MKCEICKKEYSQGKMFNGETCLVCQYYKSSTHQDRNKMTRFQKRLAIKLKHGVTL